MCSLVKTVLQAKCRNTCAILKGELSKQYVVTLFGILVLTLLVADEEIEDPTPRGK